MNTVNLVMNRDTLSTCGVVIQSLISAIINLQVSLLIRRELFERAKDFNIILDDVAITELSFSREYTAAVEAKQVGEEIQQTSNRFLNYPFPPAKQVLDVKSS